jgi:hypothetical protein
MSRNIPTAKIQKGMQLSRICRIKPLPVVAGILISLLSVDVSIGSELKATVWQDYAKSYIKNDQRLLDRANGSSEEVLSILRQRDEAMERLATSTLPRDSTLVALLQSSSILERRMALIAAIAKKTSNPSLLQTVLSQYTEKDDYLLKFYSFHLMRNLTQKQISEHSTALCTLFQQEQSESLIVSGLPLLFRLKQDDVLPIVLAYMRKGPNSLRRSVGAYMLGTNKPLFKKTLQIAEEEGMAEASEDLKRLEADN